MLLTGPAVIKLESGGEYKCIITSFQQEYTEGLSRNYIGKGAESSRKMYITSDLITTTAEITITQTKNESKKND